MAVLPVFSYPVSAVLPANREFTGKSAKIWAFFLHIKAPVLELYLDFRGLRRISLIFAKQGNISVRSGKHFAETGKKMAGETLWENSAVQCLIDELAMVSSSASIGFSVALTLLRCVPPADH